MSDDTRIEAIKAKTEEIIALLRADFPDNRCRSIAVTNYEQAAMWAVKSLS